MSAEPTTPPREAASSPVGYLVASLLVYALILATEELVSRYTYRRHLPRLVYLSPARAQALVEGRMADDLVFRVAFLSLPLLTISLGVRWLLSDPLRDLGLRGSRLLVDLPVGLVLGALAYEAVFGGQVLLAGTSDARAGWWAWLALAPSYVFTTQGWALLSLALCYGLGRLIVPLGHCYTRTAQTWGTSRAVLLGALVFALPHLANTYTSALALGNYLLAGWAFGLMRGRRGTIWRPLGLLAGWTAMQHLTDLALNDTTIEHAVSRALPTVLSGGLSGVDGSLVLTALLAGWLVLLLRPARVADGLEAAGQEPVAGEETVGEEVRPGGFEPPTP